MTSPPHLHAIAMRTAAVFARWEDHVADNSPKYLTDWQRGLVAGQQAMRAAILALPLEADPAALVAEALRLPEVRALVEAATEQAEYLSLCGEDGDLLRNLLRALQPFAALVQP